MLAGDDFQIAATGSWASPDSGATYSMGWRVRIPARGIDITLAPVIEGAEFDATSTTFNYCWEGAVRITGSHTGLGFVELVGYAPVVLPAGLRS